MYKPRNLLLQKLSGADFKEVLEAATFVQLQKRETLTEANKPIRFVYFPETGVLSKVLLLEACSPIEIATIGNEGMVGASLVMGVSSVAETVSCQVKGSAWQIKSDTFQTLIQQHSELSSVCRRYMMTLLDQVARNNCCYRKHSVEERCARWLLLAQDCCGSDEFTLTQEFLAGMLGASRTKVNLAAGMLARTKIISYARGKIRIIDRMGLEKIACDCYASVRNYYRAIMD